MLRHTFKGILFITAIALPTDLVRAQATAPKASWERTFRDVRQQYRQDGTSTRKTWLALTRLEIQAERSGNKKNLSDLNLMQAQLLERARFPMLSAHYASSALKNAEDPYATGLQPAWTMLEAISNKSQLFDLLVDLAAALPKPNEHVPAFGSDWNYFLGEAELKKGNSSAAIALFENVDIKDRYYLAARYRMAMEILNTQNDLKRAGLILRGIISTDLGRLMGTDYASKSQYIDQASLALGRIQYERQRYVSSIRYYRQVKRNSTFYYNALFEQAWSFFMSGYANQALGALHAVDSPYFPNRFNPETSILRSIIYYWMCRYDDSRSALADFIEHYAEPVNNLDEWLKKRNLSPEKGFELFENLLSGVSSESLGIDRKLLDSVSVSPAMILARDKLADVLAEKQRFERRGVFGIKHKNRFVTQRLDEWLDKLKLGVGEAYITELDSLSSQYKLLRSQANFLYVELLMSEKEHILGKELHQDEKLSKVNLSKQAKGWGAGNVPWKASDKGEYWWDEVGFFVYQVTPACNVN